jgi:hypothetical protein
MKKRPVLVAAAAAAAAAVVYAAPGVRGEGTPSFSEGGWSLEEARAFSGFDLYWAGETFQGLPLTSIDDRPPPPDLPGLPTPVIQEIDAPSVGYVSLKYGDCTPSSDAGCPAPLEIQVWRACLRTLADYQLTPDPDGAGPLEPDPYPHEKTEVRDVPAAYFEGGALLELYTGDVTVAIFGYERNQVLAAANALRPITDAVAADAPPTLPLPAPVAGALTGALPC